MTTQTCLALALNLHRNARAVYRQVQTVAFCDAMRNASEKERQEIVEYIKTYQADRLERLVKDLIRPQPTIQNLKDQARSMGIKGYSRMNSTQLQMEINRHAEKEELARSSGRGSEARASSGSLTPSR